MQQVYRSIDELQADLDLWIREYSEGENDCSLTASDTKTRSLN